MKPRPIVAIVGRPNVGKSSLFNRLIGRRLAIVHDEPGVTRDRHYAEAWSRGRTYMLVDTGGFEAGAGGGIGAHIREQVKVAVAEADVVVCVLDVSTGFTDQDREAVGMLRRAGKPVIYVGNKADTRRAEEQAGDLYRLGIPHVFLISAIHGRGIGELETAVVEALPPGETEAPPEGATDEVPEVEEEVEEEEADEDSAAKPKHRDRPRGPVRIALIGRPNAGKSSVLNRVVGEERVLVHDEPGTTRDAIDVEVTRDGRTMIWVDTAGIRRKSKVEKTSNELEAASVFQALRAIERCEIAVLLCDGAAGVAEQDAKIAGLVVDRRRALVVAVNKTDLLDAPARKELEEKARDKLSFIPFAPVVPVSAKTGRGMGSLMQTIQQVSDAFHQRVPTGELNRFFRDRLATHPPPTTGNRAPRLFFITQAETAPPLFVVMTNEPDHIHFSYQRYLTNQVRKAFGFDGVPLRVNYRKRRRRGDE
jgi:GTP-binding protein